MIHRYPLRRYRRLSRERLSVSATATGRPPHGPTRRFRTPIEARVKLYRRHPRHRLRALAEAMA